MAIVQIFCKGCSKRLVIREKHARLVELRVKPGPDKAEPVIVWDARLLRCPECDYQVIQRTHGSPPLATVYDPDFAERYQELVNQEGIAVIYVSE